LVTAQGSLTFFEAVEMSKSKIKGAMKQAHFFVFIDVGSIIFQ